ncbi:MAG: acyltransferase, partial [Rubritalea sp.]|uniref:acyltransferase family protein n=1 Tax=Rubritalea sp. TaxID=2109375 RepID=UPI003242BCC6
MNKGYIPSLDGIRTLSILIVIVSHAGFGHVVPGGLGVTTFFFLSGFLITIILMREYERTKTIHYPYFFVRRILRLAPPLFTCLAVAYGLTFIGVSQGGFSWTGILSQTFYLANYHLIFQWPGEVPEGLGILWSLAVEEHFYLFYPVVLLFLMRKFKKNGAAVGLAILCVVVLLWRNYLFIIQEVPVDRIYFGTDTRIDSILYGCILALTWNPVDAKPSSSFTTKELLITGAAGAVFIGTIFYREPIYRETFRYTLQGLCMMPLFYYAINKADHIFFSWLNWGWMRKLGVYSYGMYL